MIKEECKYLGPRIPQGLPRQGQLPFYPDPNMYPSEVMEGFRKWPELCLESQRLTYRIIDPRGKEYKSRPTLRYADSLDELVELLGEPEEKRYFETVGATMFQYSKDLWVSITVDNTVRSILLPKTRPSNGELEGWRFVFVDNAVSSTRSKALAED